MLAESRAPSALPPTEWQPAELAPGAPKVRQCDSATVHSAPLAKLWLVGSFTEQSDLYGMV